MFRKIGLVLLDNVFEGIALIGFASLLYGLALAWPPLAYVVGGLAGLAFGFWGALKMGDNHDEQS